MFGHNPFADSPFAALPTQGGGGTSITGTLAVTLDDIIVASVGTIAHNGNLTAVLDDIALAVSGVVVHNGNLTATLDDISFAGTGADTHTGSLTVSLDDIAVAASGIVKHNGTLAFTLDDIIFDARGVGRITGAMALTLESVTFLAAGADVHAGSLAVTLEDIIFLANQEPEPIALPSKGGIKAKKKEYKNNSADVKKAIEDAVEAVTGEPKPKVKAAPKVEEKPVTFVEDYEAILRMETEKAALELAIAQMLEDERDDEEAILLLL
jgi:hypothetical protein